MVLWMCEEEEGWAKLCSCKGNREQGEVLLSCVSHGVASTVFSAKRSKGLSPGDKPSGGTVG